jgi:type IV pilus assembly protein PilQ
MINLDIEPRVRVLAGTIATLNGLEDPLFEEKSVKTSVTIKDGFTLALGGLVEQVSSDQSTAVPLLSKLPGFGRLFKSNSTNVETNNLIIFITAKTLNPDGSTYRDVVDPRVLDQMEIDPTELPGYQIGPAALDQLQQLEAHRIAKSRGQASALRKARLKGVQKKSPPSIHSEDIE